MLKGVFMKNKNLVPEMEKATNNYLVVCKGGIVKFNDKQSAIQNIEHKEQYFIVRLYESVSVDENGFDVLKCIYFTGCNLRLKEI